MAPTDGQPRHQRSQRQRSAAAVSPGNTNQRMSVTLVLFERRGHQRLPRPPRNEKSRQHDRISLSPHPPAELPLDEFLRRRSHLDPRACIGRQFDDGGGERRGITWRNVASGSGSLERRAGFAVHGQEIGRSAAMASNILDGSTVLKTSDGLERHQRDVGRREDAGHLAARAR